MRTLKWFYQSRDDRSRWLVERFFEYFEQSNSLLDVGCFNKTISKYMPSTISRYVGVDLYGEADIRIDLDKVECLPFQDGEFDIVVCADVLEHLENIHLIFDELCRVSNQYLIVTLPNSFAEIPSILRKASYAKSPEQRSRFGKNLKFYGLPFERPEDRHRWFFDYTEAEEFINYRLNKNNFELVSSESELEHMPMGMRSFLLKTCALLNKNLIARNYIGLFKRAH